MDGDAQTPGCDMEECVCVCMCMCVGGGEEAKSHL